jgi:hypothetical protein
MFQELSTARVDLLVVAQDVPQKAVETKARRALNTTERGP